MRELQRKQRLKQALYSYPSLLILLIISFFFAKAAVGIMMVERESARKAEELEEESAELLSRESVLKENIEKLKTEEGIIEEIKNKFSATREGEYVAVIVDEKAKVATSSPSILETWYKGILNAIIFWQ